MEGLESDQDCRDQVTKNEMIRCYTMQLFKNNRFYKLKINISNAKGYLHSGQKCLPWQACL